MGGNQSVDIPGGGTEGYHVLRVSDVRVDVDRCLFLPLLITVAKILPVAYYPSKDVATYLSKSRSSLSCDI